jgi:biotin carboxyl carrier protein
MEEEHKHEKFESLNVDYTEYKTKLSRKYTLRKPYIPPDPRKILSFIPGTINKIYVKEKDKVKAGDKLLILEAMKMKNDIVTSINGKIKKIHVKVDERVANKQLLVELE